MINRETLKPALAQVFGFSLSFRLFIDFLEPRFILYRIRQIVTVRTLNTTQKSLLASYNRRCIPTGKRIWWSIENEIRD